MPTINQLSKGIRKRSKGGKVRRFLEGCPQRKGVCIRVYTVKPKKPNSAIRKIAKVRLSTKKQIRAFITGKGHNLQKFSVVLVRGGRVRDLPGIHYKMIRGKEDLVGREDFERTNRRSKFGTPKRKWKE